MGTGFSLSITNLENPIPFLLRAYRFINGAIRQWDQIQSSIRLISKVPAVLGVDFEVDTSELIGRSVMLTTGLSVSGYLPDTTYPAFQGVANLMDIQGVTVDGLSDLKQVLSDQTRLSNISFVAQGRREGISSMSFIFSGSVLASVLKVAFEIKASNIDEMVMDSHKDSSDILLVEPQLCPLVPLLNLAF